ncbi:MAG: hypothetical protein V4764_06845 [Burkholderia sp.]
MPNPPIPIAGDLALPGWHALRTVQFGQSWALLAGHAADRHPSFVRATCRAAFATFVGAANRSHATAAAPVALARDPRGISSRDMRLAACWTIGALGVLGGLVFGTSRGSEATPAPTAPPQPATTSAKPLAALAAVTAPGEHREVAASAAATSVKPATPPHAVPAGKAPAHTPSHAALHRAKSHPAAATPAKRSYAVPLAGKTPVKPRAHPAAQAPRAAGSQGDARAAHDREALRARRWREIGAMQGSAPHATPRARVSSGGNPTAAHPPPAVAHTYPHPVSHPRPAPRLAQLAQLNEPAEPAPRVRERLAPLRDETPALLVATPGTGAPVAVQTAAAAPGHIEIVIGHATVRIEGDVDPAVLRHVLEALPA